MSIETLPKFVSPDIRTDFFYTVEIQDNKGQYWIRVTRKDGKMRHAESQEFDCSNEAEKKAAVESTRSFIAQCMLPEE